MLFKASVALLALSGVVSALPEFHRGRTTRTTAKTTAKTTTKTTSKTSTTTTTSATPTNTCPSTGTQFNANFDDLTGVPGSELNPIPTPYDGLYFQGFDYTTVVQTNAAPGVVPHSGANYAAANVLTEVNGTPMLTVYYPGSTVKSFDLQNFYFGCALNLGQGIAAAPQACNVEFTGYQGSDNSISNAKQVFSQQFQYNPTASALGVAQMAYSGPVNNANCVNFVIVTFSIPGGEAAAGTDLALVLDDIMYTTHSS